MSDPRITDEAVEAATRSLHPGLFEDDGLLHPALAHSGQWQARHKVRAALEAALPHLAPQSDDEAALPVRADGGGNPAAASSSPQPVDDEDDDTPWPSGLSLDNPFLTTPPPIGRDQIAEALHAHDQERARIYCGWQNASGMTKHTYLGYADAVLALLNGGASREPARVDPAAAFDAFDNRPDIEDTQANRDMFAAGYQQALTDLNGSQSNG